ncbi:MAG: alanine racemase [Fibrobacter sp.]|nr:alanine racemase [Fibrobacter sp.]
MEKSVFSPRVEIQIENLLFNLDQIRNLAGPKAGIIAVIKDNAYGCGSIIIAKTLEQKRGISFFAVARPEEAFKLRNEGIKSEILVLGKATPQQLKDGYKKNLVFTLNGPADLKTWSSLNNPVRFHCNVDTGMSRLGLLPHQSNILIEHLEKYPNLLLNGVFTHMACADQPGTETISKQLAVFQNFLSALKSAGIIPEHIHFSNSATTMKYTSDICTMVRPGIALYGCNPDPNQKFSVELKPVLSLKSSIIELRQFPPQSPVSYGGNYVTTSNTWIATIAGGYGQGLPRALSSKGSVLIGGKRFKIAGNVTMDYIMVDVGSDPEVKTGDEVVLIGQQGNESITPDDIAKLTGTIGYEILCNIGTAIDRFYLLNDSIVLHEHGTIF